jgi:hypothetical protein
MPIPAFELPVLDFPSSTPDDASTIPPLYTPVTLADDGRFTVSAAGANGAGFLQGQPGELQPTVGDRGAAIRGLGITFCVAAAPIAVEIDVASNGDGRMKAAGTGDFVRGKSITAAGAAGDYFAVMVNPVPHKKQA